MIADPAAGRLRISGVWPQTVSLHPGEHATLALSGQDLQTLDRPRAQLGEAEAPGIGVQLGTAGSALRDVFVTARPGVPPGLYGITVSVGGVTARLPVVIRVLPASELQTRNIPTREPSPDLLARQRQLLFGVR